MTTPTNPSTGTNNIHRDPASTHPYTYTLYTFFGSSCSARVRIAAHLRSIPLTYIYIDLLTLQQRTPEYLALNPSAFVPLLVVKSASRPDEIMATISQSGAIIEFWEEVWPLEPFLLPAGKERALERAKVRELWGVIACDTQPVTNQRVVRRLKEVSVGEKEGEWQAEFMETGLKAYEELMKRGGFGGGRFSVGDEVTMADVALVAAVDRARRYKVEVGGVGLEGVGRVDANVRALEAYKKGGFRGQEDTPVGQRL